MQQIAGWELAYQEELNRGFSRLSEGSFKGLRRQLPITRQKVEWEKVGGYRVCFFPHFEFFPTEILLQIIYSAPPTRYFLLVGRNNGDELTVFSNIYSWAKISAGDDLDEEKNF